MQIIYPLIILSTGLVSAELYTSLSNMKELLESEDVLGNLLSAYAEQQQQRLDTIKRYATMYATPKNDTYLDNPINAYLLIKRLTVDLNRFEDFLATDVDQKFVEEFGQAKRELTLPSEEDLNGAVVGLVRLQDTYRLETLVMADGVLNGVKLGTELTADDCFEIGRQMHDDEDYRYSELWMNEAERRLEKESEWNGRRSEIFQYLAFSAFKKGKVEIALEYTNKVLELFPDHPKALPNKVYYESLLNTSIDDELDHEDQQTEQTVPTPTELPKTAFKNAADKKIYGELCRGETGLPPEIQSQLRCFFQRDGKNAFLILAPFKVEEAYRDPKLLIYHDVMSDSEIETVKELTQWRLVRAQVFQAIGKFAQASFRISKYSWLKDEEDQLVARLSRRVGDMTGLSVETAEWFQVVNYGIGGHYESHYDYTPEYNLESCDTVGPGNRIATVLFYMSDVSQGGATVFPYIKTALWPKKGAAAFWYNLHASTEGDVRMRHAGCPVLVGSKWICNKWIHERGQEFRRPCGLEPAPRELVTFTKSPLKLPNRN